MADYGQRPLKRRIGDLVVAAAVYLAYGLFSILPVDTASALGGYIARTVGPKLRVTRRAKANLAAAFPEKSETEITSIVDAMWESLGRIAAETPHLGTLVQDIGQPRARIEVVGTENIDRIPNGEPLIYVTGHLSNWELMLRGIAALGFPGSPVYRAPNNRFLDGLMKRIRDVPESELVPKGSAGARVALDLLARGKRLIILADQKLNDGIPVPFFGREAMTAPALARFTLRYNCPLIPLHIERIKGTRFRLHIGAPLKLAMASDGREQITEIMTEVNLMLERWIREHPEQWLWLHNRWPK